MKILFFITSLDVGGAERQVLDLAQRLVARDHHVKVVYLTGSGRLLSSNEPFEVIGLEGAKSLRSLISCLFALRAVIKSFKPDVVHSHMVHANLLARLVRVITPIPRLICTAHSNNEGGKLRMLAYRATNFLADVTTNVSSGAVQAFEAKGAVKSGEMLVVPNGIDTQKFMFKESARSLIRSAEGVEAGDKLILAVGRLVEAKDYPNLLRAFQILCRDDDTLKLWIVGDGELKEKLVNLSIQLSIHNRVRFLGVRDNVSDFYSCADVYVLSSAWEGFGLVVAEAMATERVVVVTDSGGVKEVVGDQGLVVSPGDANALATAVRRALDFGPRDAEILGVQARDRVIERYSLDNVVTTWVNLYSAPATPR